MLMKPEEIDQWSFRIKVHGGWVLDRISQHKTTIFGFIPWKKSVNTSVFIPDPDHIWIPDNGKT